jgi:TonB family protein
MAPPNKNATSKDGVANSDPPPPPTAPDNDAPPTIEIASSSTPEELTRLTSASVKMPSLGVTVSQGVVEANLLHKVDPVYPAAARSRGVTGSVVLDAAIKENGSVGKVKIVSGPAILADAAINALHEWKYSPTLLNGKPVQAQKRITFVFKLP